MSKIDFVGRRKVWFSISATLMIITVVAALVFGTKLDIQFSGGTMVTYSFDGEINKDEFASVVGGALQGKHLTVREQQNVSTGATNYVVTLAEKTGITPEQQIAVTDALATKYSTQNLQVSSISNVDPTIGGDFLKKSMAAVILAAVLMIGYIALRFRKMNGWSAGVIAVMALLHDLVIVFAVFVICQFPLNDSFIAVLLTILGYSINNTIIIYDRIRENKQLMSKKISYSELVNCSISQSMARSINTTISTALSMLVVCILSMVYGVESILTFSFPLLVGMLAGFFSSVFISAPLWGWWQDRKITTRHKTA